MKRIYDLSALKQEFFDSDFYAVSSFLTHKGLKTKINGKDTKGRDKEKEAYQKERINKAIKIKLNKEAKQLSKEIDLEKLIRIKNTLFDAIEDAVNDIYNSEKKNSQDIERYLKLTKTELGEDKTTDDNGEDNSAVVEYHTV